MVVPCVPIVCCCFFSIPVLETWEKKLLVWKYKMCDEHGWWWWRWFEMQVERQKSPFFIYSIYAIIHIEMYGRERHKSLLMVRFDPRNSVWRLWMRMYVVITIFYTKIRNICVWGLHIYENGFKWIGPTMEERIIIDIVSGRIYCIISNPMVNCGRLDRWMNWMAWMDRWKDEWFGGI